jgi:transposase InsO family protein
MISLSNHPKKESRISWWLTTTSPFAISVPTRNRTARNTAEAIFNNFILHYWIPEQLHSDQETNFCSNIIKELCLLLGITKSRTTPYHPMGNGITESFNRTLLSMLKTLKNCQKSECKSHIKNLVHAYNSTVHDTTYRFKVYFYQTS